MFSVKPRWPLQAEDGMTSVSPQSVTQPFTQPGGKGLLLQPGEWPAPALILP